MKNSPLTIRFALDAMLGRLARHLLHTGYDCVYHDQIDDSRLADLAHSQDRIVLTRDRDFVRDVSLRAETYVLENTALGESFRRLAAAFRLGFHTDFFFTRCSKCNESLNPVTKREVRDSIPDETAEWIDTYYRCGTCEKLYWKGSHHEDLVNKLDRWSLLSQRP